MTSWTGNAAAAHRAFQRMLDELAEDGTVRVTLHTGLADDGAPPPFGRVYRARRRREDPAGHRRRVQEELRADAHPRVGTPRPPIPAPEPLPERLRWEAIRRDRPPPEAGR